MKRFFKIGLLVALAIAFAGCTSPSAPLSSDKEVTSFAFLAANNTGFSQDYTASYNAISGAYTAGPLPAGTSLQAVVASFEVSPGASLSVDGVPQESGVTANDFSSAKTYTITAADGSTSTFNVSLTRTALGLSAFDVAGATLSLGQANSVTINDTVSPRTVVVHVAYHFASEVSALKPTLTSNGASVTVNGAAHINGTSVYDFTSPVTFVVNGQSGVSESYKVSVVVDAAVTEALISSFSIATGAFTCVGVIDDTAGTIAVKLPSGTSTDALVATFAASKWATVAIEAADQVSGTTANNFSSALTYTVTAEDGTQKLYTVTATPNPVVARFLEICPSYSSVYAQAGAEWLDIQLVDVSELGTGWTIKASNDAYTNDLFTSSLVADIPAVILDALADGDIIRLHKKGYASLDTTADKAGDGVNLDRWDLAVSSTTYFTNYKHSVVSIQKSDGTILDLVAYTSSANTGAWVSSTGLATLTAAVEQAQWPSTSIASAVAIGDTTLNTCHLKSDISIDGNSAADWEAYQAPMVKLVDATVTPSWAQVTSSGSDVNVTITVGTQIFGAATVTAVSADLSDPVFGGTNSEALTVNGDGTYSITWPIPAADVAEAEHQIAIAATGSVAIAGTSVTLAVSPNPPPAPMKAFNNSDFESGGPGTLGGNCTIDITDKYEGTASLRYAATLSAHATVTVTTDKFVPLTLGYTKFTFWFKGASTGEIRFQLGGGGSVVNYFNMSDIVSGTTYTPSLTAGGSYAATPINVTEWTKVEVDLSTLAFTTVGNTIDDYSLVFRVRNGTTHDWRIDNVQFEP